MKWYKFPDELPPTGRVLLLLGYDYRDDKYHIDIGGWHWSDGIRFFIESKIEHPEFIKMWAYSAEIDLAYGNGKIQSIRNVIRILDRQLSSLIEISTMLDHNKEYLLTLFKLLDKENGLSELMVRFIEDRIKAVVDDWKCCGDDETNPS